MSARLATLDRYIGDVRLRGEKLTREVEVSESGQRTAGVSTTLGVDPSIKGTLGAKDCHASRHRDQSSGAAIADVNFTALNEALRDLLDAAGIDTVLLLVDEWSKIDPDIQPDLAAFLTSALPKERFVLKFGAIEFRSSFSRPLPRNRQVGLEHGSEVRLAVDLDDLFVVERQESHLVDLCSELLFKHASVGAALAALSTSGPSKQKIPRSFFDRRSREDVDHLLRELAAMVGEDEWWGASFMHKVGDRFMSEHFQSDTDSRFRENLFATTPLPAFTELVRGAGGVVRDLLKLFARSYEEALLRRDAELIEVMDVRRAAAYLYEAEKVKNLTEPGERDLTELIRMTLGGEGTRFFSVAPRGQWADRVLKLWDWRVVHRVGRGYTDPDAVGSRYDVYSLDYGVYSVRWRMMSPPTTTSRSRTTERDGGAPSSRRASRSSPVTSTADRLDPPTTGGSSRRESSAEQVPS